MYNATKSVPPVDAFAFNAMTVINPYKSPPKIIFNKQSSNTASKCNTFKKNDAKATCSNEKKVNLLLMLLLQNKATGIFKANIPNDVENVNPKKVLVIFSIKIATPVKPELSRFKGLMKI